MITLCRGYQAFGIGEVDRMDFRDGRPWYGVAGVIVILLVIAHEVGLAAYPRRNREPPRLFIVPGVKDPKDRIHGTVCRARWGKKRDC